MATDKFILDPSVSHQSIYTVTFPMQDDFDVALNQNYRLVEKKLFEKDGYVLAVAKFSRK